MFPLTHQLSRLRDQAQVKEVHLTFLRTSFRTFLSTLLTPIPGEEKRPSVVIAHPPGQLCDLGGIATAVHCHAAGWHPLVLGGPVCAEEVVDAAHTVHASAVVIAVVSDRYSPTILTELSRVRAIAPAHIPVYFGGRMPAALVQDIEEAGLTSLKDMNAVRVEFGRLTEVVPA